MPAFQDEVERVNLGGSRNILKAAIDNNVEAIGEIMYTVNLRTKHLTVVSMQIKRECRITN